MNWARFGRHGISNVAAMFPTDQNTFVKQEIPV